MAAAAVSLDCFCFLVFSLILEENGSSCNSQNPLSVVYLCNACN